MTKLVPSFLRLILLPLIFAPLLTSCGATYKEVSVKDYRIFVQADDRVVRERVQSVILDFNQHAGFKALTICAREDESNSKIIVKSGIYNPHDRTLGWGQWIQETSTEHPEFLVAGEGTETIHHTLYAELDREYLTTRVTKPTAEGNREIQTLIYHELGHGLEMDHADHDKSSIMYPDVTADPRNLDAFFLRVRAYFNR